MRIPALVVPLLLAPLLLADPALAAEVHGVPLPRGSRVVSGDHFRSSRGFRKTTEFYQRHLKRNAIPHRAVPIYRYRGVVVARFIAETQGGKWAAIHVFLAGGQTQITIVPAVAEAPKTLDAAAKPR